jgi:hypothetical protein
MKKAWLVLLVGSLGAWLAHAHVAAQSYYPVVKIATREGLSYTAVLDRVAERRACKEANRRFIGPVKSNCAECEVVFARCERELKGLELALQRHEPISHPLVASPGLRLAIVGARQAAQSSCRAIASGILRQGLSSASCVPPRAAS